MPRFYRKIIKIRGDDSPNVRLALAQIRAGYEPTNEILIPGVLPWSDYKKRRDTWDVVRQCVGLDAEFWEGAENFLFPPDWLNRAERLHEEISASRVARTARAIGVDPAEGGDKTAMCAVDEYGILELVSRKTPNTAVITNECLAFMLRHKVPAERVVFDRGGGGKQHADLLRARGHGVATVHFGEPVKPPPGKFTPRTVLFQQEERTIFKNRRAELYYTLHQLLDPNPAADFLAHSTAPVSLRFLLKPGQGFAIPALYTELRQELSPIPLIYDEEGKLILPPKRRKPGTKVGTGQKSLEEMIGHSPDMADALVLAVYGMVHKIHRQKAGALWR